MNLIKKVQNVNFSYILLILLSCGANKTEYSDSFAVKIITEQICSMSKDTFLLNENASNISILSLYSEPLSYSLSYELQDLVAKILTQENYEYFKSQVKDSKWDIETLSLIPCKAKLITRKEINAHYKPNLYISKPLYTKDIQYALVIYTYKSMSSLIIFKRENNEWVKEAFIPVGIS